MDTSKFLHRAPMFIIKQCIYFNLSMFKSRIESVKKYGIRKNLLKHIRNKCKLLRSATDILTKNYPLSYCICFGAVK